MQECQLNDISNMYSLKNMFNFDSLHKVFEVFY